MSSCDSDSDSDTDTDSDDDVQAACQRWHDNTYWSLKGGPGITELHKAG